MAQIFELTSVEQEGCFVVANFLLLEPHEISSAFASIYFCWSSELHRLRSIVVNFSVRLAER